MRKIVSFLMGIALSLLTVCIYAQPFSPGFSGTVQQDILQNGKPVLAQGTKIELTDIRYQGKEALYFVQTAGGTSSISSGQLTLIGFETPAGLNDLWTLLKITHGWYDNYARYGRQNDLRMDLREESLETVRQIYEKEGFVNDPAILNYLDLLLKRLTPPGQQETVPASLRVLVMKAADPVSLCLPDGTIIFSAGLICQLRSEEELCGIMGREAAHLILDQPVININAHADRQKKADFWVVFSTILTAAAEIALNSHNHDMPYFFYEPGDMTFLASSLSGLIASSVTERMGNRFSDQQANEAGASAMDILYFKGMDPYALNRAEQRIDSYFGERTDSAQSDSLYKYADPAYDTHISPLLTLTAGIELHEDHPGEALSLVERNFSNNLAVQEDYLVKAKALMALQYAPDADQQALSLLKKAEPLGDRKMKAILREEGRILMRLKEFEPASLCFSRYLDLLPTTEVQEIEWTRDMITRCHQLSSEKQP